ncbi:MAG: thrombospondin type 3 repeat-containing protein [Myxococcota bacterium]|nr:hypothetical protein [Deltaproteobacteria bacterium]MDQ3335080.1 thrombospondin type 3 repeat-containing protein [Myxococcota bacterium]
MKALVTLALVLAATDAAAQSFPVDAQWDPLFCDQIVMIDRFQDEAGATAERDIVGNRDAPAAMYAADASFLYLRMRLDQDPIPTPPTVATASWGFAVNLDTDLRNYEILLLVDGTGPQQNVVVYRNTMTVTPNDPTDPAEMSVMTFPISTHAQKRSAQGSQFGGGNDFWLELAVPWSTLTPLGFGRTTPIRVWAASSTASNALDGDFACHDGATGEPVLDVIISDPTTGDPDVDTDMDGFTDAEEVAAGSNPNDANSVPTSRLEGGGGCAAGGGGLGAALALLMLRRSRRRVRSYDGG